MSEIDEIKKRFEEKLDKQKQAHQERLESDIQSLRNSFLRKLNVRFPADLDRQVSELTTRFTSQATLSAVRALVDITTTNPLRELDEAFIKIFKFDHHKYPLDWLKYSTSYCETLEEFFTPIVDQLVLSPEERRALLERKVAEALDEASKGHRWYGYILPGKGAYLNGWLFAYNQDFSALEALNRPEVKNHILATAIHEKLGHGFLSEYSELGKVNRRLGLTLMDLARRFKLQSADDPTSTLRVAQVNLLYSASQLLEEGWATWVETYLVSSLYGTGPHPRAILGNVVEAIHFLPNQLQYREEIQESLLGALVLLFSEKDVPRELLLEAVIILETTNEKMDDLFSKQLGQPLRYQVGELILHQAEVNLGALCVPFAALIAAGVTFDTAQMGLSDLGALLRGDPRLNPDARMTALSRLRLAEKDSVACLTRTAAAQLSFSIPAELTRGG